MKARLKMAIKACLPAAVMNIWRARQERIQAKSLYLHDFSTMIRCSYAFRAPSREAALAHVIMNYHVIEKGLTMPKRHLWFGKIAVCELIETLSGFARHFGDDDVEFRHGVGVVKSYRQLHEEAAPHTEAADIQGLWLKIVSFCNKYPDIPISQQFHFTKEDFYRYCNAPFDVFARSRHTCRHFVEGASVLDEDIKAAVELAQTAPSACNRQHVRVHCVSNPEIKERVRSLQGGNRGFGHLADKFLVITSDISDLYWAVERYDLYTNAGIFVMNLCYALHFRKIAHCILHCSLRPSADMELRRVLSIPENERFVCMIACGIAPDEFNVAASKRKPIDSIFFMH